MGVDPTPKKAIMFSQRINDATELRLLEVRHAEPLFTLIDSFRPTSDDGSPGSTSLHGARMAAEGLGLGLYVARGLVEAQGGTLWGESRPGDTTVFRFSVPASTRRAEHEAPSRGP
jgi:hypothetical protein